jgi:D-arabinose 1-dehydrogenase-like Zn-dependent alcohol dehydrogenase
LSNVAEEPHQRSMSKKHTKHKRGINGAPLFDPASEFLKIAPKAQIKTTTVSYPLGAANEALADLREGRLQGAAVLRP